MKLSPEAKIPLAVWPRRGAGGDVGEETPSSAPVMQSGSPGAGEGNYLGMGREDIWGWGRKLFGDGEGSYMGTGKQNPT